MSDQIEKQDWTDDLRIALPAIGLLLLLALFWFWAGSLIDDGDDAPSLAVVSVATQDTVGTYQDMPAAPAPTSATGLDVAPTQDGQDRKPGSGFAVGTIVVTTEDGVRLRRGPSTDTNVVQELGLKGTVELRVTGAGQRDGQELWYPVTDVARATSGYVRGDLLQRSE
ncbi:MAG: hypothetical protein M3Q71_15115 [Chloroflexota bacterium]|nr:hypothetical protein [Chloroflexota bacterium]